MLFFFILTIVSLDQLSKLWALKLSAPILIWTERFSIQTVFNYGAAFSLPFKNWFLISVALFFFLAIFWQRKSLAKQPKIIKIATSTIIGGAIGNLIDRLRFGYVIDFISLKPFPIFNLADTALTIGAMIILFYIIFHYEHRNKSQ